MDGSPCEQPDGPLHPGGKQSRLTSQFYDNSLELHGVRAGELGSGMWREDSLGQWLQEAGGMGKNPHTGRAVSGKRRRTRSEGQYSREGGGKKQVAHCSLPVNSILRMAE